MRCCCGGLSSPIRVIGLNWRREHQRGEGHLDIAGRGAQGNVETPFAIEASHLVAGSWYSLNMGIWQRFPVFIEHCKGDGLLGIRIGSRARLTVRKIDTGFRDL